MYCDSLTNRLRLARVCVFIVDRIDSLATGTEHLRAFTISCHWLMSNLNRKISWLHLLAVSLLPIGLALAQDSRAADAGLVRGTGGAISGELKETGAIVLIHGWNPDEHSNMFDNSEWQNLRARLNARIVAAKANWQLLQYDWSESAKTGPSPSFAHPSEAARRAYEDEGPVLAAQLKEKMPELRRLMLVAHSAGTWAAVKAANLLLSDPDLPYLTINVVLLDPFIPGTNAADTNKHLNTALVNSLAQHQEEHRIHRLENYYSNDVLLDSDFWFGATSEIFLGWSYFDPRFPGLLLGTRHIEGLRLDYGISPPIYNEHSSAVKFYADTVLATTPGETVPSDLEGGDWDHTRYGFFISLFQDEVDERLPKITGHFVGRLGKITDYPINVSVTTGTPFELIVDSNNVGADGYKWFRNKRPYEKTIVSNEETNDGRLSSPSAEKTTSPVEYVLALQNGIGLTFSNRFRVKVVDSPIPKITDVDPPTIDAKPLPQTQRIAIIGTGFNSQSRLNFYDPAGTPFNNRMPISATPTRLEYDIVVGETSGTWAVRVANGTEELSDPVSFYVRTTYAKPTQPSEPNATDGTFATKVAITWQAVAGATTYEVLRCASMPLSTCIPIANTAALSADDSSGGFGTIYYYRVKACNSIGCSEPSAADSGYRGLSANLQPPSTVTASDGAYPTGVLVTWSAVTGAARYVLWRATSLTGIKTALDTEITHTTYADAPVTPGRTYYYWVTACFYTGACSALSSPDTGFASQVSTGGPGAASNPDPPSDANGVSINVNELTWSAGNGATSYDVYFGTDTTPDSSESIGSTAATSRNIAQLEYNTTYYWRVDTRANGQTVTGPVWKFTTRTQSAGEPPARAINPNPAQNADEVPPSNVVLRWGNGGGATAYDVYFGTHFEPGEAQRVGETTSTSWALPLLERSKHYYWRIKAKNAGGIAKGDIWHFKTEDSAPGAAYSPYPSAGQTDVQTTSLILYWQDLGGTAKSYDVYFGTDPTPDASELVSTTTQDLWQTPTLQPNTTYYWQIVSKNNGGATNGPVWSFTTWASAPGILSVSSGGFAARGPVGGPVSNPSRRFLLTNTGQQPLDFSVSTTLPWLQVIPTTGTLQPGGQTEATVTITSGANTLPAGFHYDTVKFNNNSNFRGTDLRAVSLAAGVATQPNDVETLVGGFSTMFAVKSDGSLYGWGLNESSELGLGSLAPASIPAPVRLGLRADWKSVSTRWKHVLAITTDGRLFAWGDNAQSQLGLGDNVSRLVPTQVGTESDWVMASAGLTHSLALKADGRLFAFGFSNDGQLGLGDTSPRNVPTQVGVETDWSFIQAGTNRSIALKSNGKLYSWGDSAGSDGRNRNAPEQVGAFSDWIAVSSTNYHILAIRSNGALYTWGSGGPELGLGDTARRNAPVQVGSDVDWVAVQAGDDHSLGLRRDGRLFGWGRNLYNQLALSDRSDKLVPVLIYQNPAIHQILVTHGASHVLLNDGRAYSWGRNESGKLGLGYEWNGNSTRVPSPTEIDFNWALATTPTSLVAVKSRIQHGAAGSFDLTLDLSQPANGNVTVESRVTSSGHSLVFQFSDAVTSIESASVIPSGNATATYSGNEVIVALSGLTNAQRITVSLSGINGTGSAQASFGLLTGDINSSRSVNATDISGIKARSGQTVNDSNFRFDLNASGGINATDISAVKARAGLVMP